MSYKFSQWFGLASLLLMLCSYQVIRTQLRVTILDDLGNVRPGAKVSLYKTTKDFNDNKRAYGPIEADEKGRAIFFSVENGPFYLEAVDGDYSNDFGGQLTDTLQEGKINKLNVIISK